MDDIQLLGAAAIVIAVVVLFGVLGARGRSKNTSAKSVRGTVGNSLPSAGDAAADNGGASPAVTGIGDEPAGDYRMVSSFDIARSDLGNIEQKLERILSALDGGMGADIRAVVNRLEDVRSLLREISGKLDRR